MKRIFLAVIVLFAIAGLGVAYKFGVFGSLFGGGSSAVAAQPSAGPAPSGSTGLTYATPAAMVVPPIGGYHLDTVDLGDGPVPLLTMPLDTWGGYAALFAANGGLDPNKNSLFYKDGHFAVKIVHVEAAEDQLKGYAAGTYPIIWAQMDSMPILFDGFRTDKRAIPKTLGLFDWSNGGDGVIAKSTVKSPGDLRGKTILTSSNSPYAFMLLWYLAQNNLTGNDVKIVWVDDGAKALDLFKNNNEIAAWVTWSPYLQDALDSKSPSYVPGSRLLINSKDANQLIADLYVIRNDLLTEHPEIATGFLKAMLDGSQAIDATTFETMATFYQIKPEDAQAMLNDVHIANFPDNQKFFDPANDVGASKIFTLAQAYYKELGSLGANNYDVGSVLTPKILGGIAKSGAFAGQTSTLNKAVTFDTTDLTDQRVVLTNNVQLYFDPEQTTFNPHAGTADVNKNMKLLGGVEEQTKFLSTTVVKLTGYIYTSTAEIEATKAKGINDLTKAQSDAVIFSKKRAEFIKQILVKNYGISPDRIVTEGGGWDSPMNDNDPNSNRRVEVNFISSQ